MGQQDLITLVETNYSRIYIGGIPLMLNDDGAFLSFICSLTAMEALGGFLEPKLKNCPRFKEFAKRYFPKQYASLIDSLWKLRNAAVHGFSPGPFKLTHHNSGFHLTTDAGQTILNAEDFFADLVVASKKYFVDLRANTQLQQNFEDRANDPDTGVLVVGPAKGTP